jgi:ABC-type branched-subunit amino acid transport system substrate-binding protein
VALALEEYARELPGARLRSERPLALLRCNSNNDEFVARNALKHLRDIGVPLVITLTDADTRAIRYQAARANTPVICSSCYAKPSDVLDENRLVWQIAPPLVEQAPLAAARVGELAAAASAPGDPAAVVMLSQDYWGINEFVTELRRLLASRGTPIVLPIQTRPREGLDPAAVAAAVIDARPRVIAVGMDSDFTTYHLRLIEAEWPEGEPRPHYVLSSMNQELGLLADIIGGDDDLRVRISGTGFWPGPESSSNLRGLEERFFERHRSRIDQTQFGYDAFYAAAYAIAWADPRGALDGPGLSEGLGHLLSGTPIDVGPSAVRTGLARLDAGEDIDLVGTSNGLDWQATTHATHSDVTLWCISRAPDGGLVMTLSAGPVWQRGSGEISGVYSCP